MCGDSDGREEGKEALCCHGVVGEVWMIVL